MGDLHDLGRPRRCASPAARHPRHFSPPHTDCERRQTLRAWVRARDPRVRNALRRARWRLDALSSAYANAPVPQKIQARARRLQTWRSQSAEKVVDEEWWRRTSISSAWARLLDILFVGGHEAISPVRCAPPSPVLRPRSRISRCFCSFAPPCARLCLPLPLHARASDGARAGTKVAPDPELHAAAARAASRPRQRRRGRLGRRRLGPLLR